jgi:hypothetical protein
MWSTETLWFDASIVLGIFAIGNILFGHFEAHRPKWRRLLKVVLFLAIVLTLSAYVGRIWAYSFLAGILVVALYVHAVWLPRHGINGWTGEPRERYLELVTRKLR